MSNDALQSMDFPALVQQEVNQLVGGWYEAGLTEEDIQECYAKMFEMGGVASQLIVQEGGIQPEGAPRAIPYSPEMAQRLVHYFLKGMDSAVIKSYQQQLPSVEKWEFLQKSALHVFEQSKQAIIATLGQEHTPDVQISDDQIYSWLNQTSVEALLYYLAEHERQFGPLTQPMDSSFPEVSQATSDQPMEAMAPEPAEEEIYAPDPYAEPEPVYTDEPAETIPEPIPVAASAAPTQTADIYHKYAAIGLISSTLAPEQSQRLLAAFDSDTQALIYKYQQPEQLIADHLDLRRVAHYVRSFKGRLSDLLGKAAEPKVSTYMTALSTVIQHLPQPRIEKLFQQERANVRGYLTQFIQTQSDDQQEPIEANQAPYTLPSGVEESLWLYLKRNFPDLWQQIQDQYAAEDQWTEESQAQTEEEWV